MYTCDGPRLPGPRAPCRCCRQTLAVERPRRNFCMPPARSCAQPRRETKTAPLRLACCAAQPGARPSAGRAPWLPARPCPQTMQLIRQTMQLIRQTARGSLLRCLQLALLGGALSASWAGPAAEAQQGAPGAAPSPSATSRPRFESRPRSAGPPGHRRRPPPLAAVGPEAQKQLELPQPGYPRARQRKLAFNRLTPKSQNRQRVLGCVLNI